MPTLPIAVYGHIYETAFEKFGFYIQSLLGLQKYEGDLGVYKNIVGVNVTGGSLVLCFSKAYVCLDIDGKLHSTISPALYIQPCAQVLDANKWDRHYYLHGTEYSRAQWLVKSKEYRLLEFESKIKKSIESNSEGK